MSRYLDLPALLQTFPEYADFRVLAENDKGAVLDCFSRHRGHRVALKLTADRGDAETRARFDREFDILFANQHHERLVRLYGDRGCRPVRMWNGAIVNHFYFSMKLYHRDVGKALGERALDLCARLMVVLQMLEGLAYLHAKGIAHRDIKPTNLFLDQPDPAQAQLPHPIAVRLGDFDIAQVRAVLPGVTDAPVGTLYYLAPERWGRAPGDAADTAVDFRPSDQYAAGVTAFQILSQGYLPLDFRPVHGGDHRAYQQIHQHGARLPLLIPERAAAGAGAPLSRLDKVLWRMIAVSPGDRYPDLMRCMTELRVALAGYALWPCEHRPGRA